MFAAMAAGFAYRLVSIPKWYVDSRSNVGLGVAVNEYRAAVASAMSGLVQMAGGLVVALGAFVAWRQLTLLRRQHLHTVFSGAMQNLGSEVVGHRVGALWLFEGLVVEEPEQFDRIGDIVGEFVRARAVALSATRPEDRESRDLYVGIALCGRLGVKVDFSGLTLKDFVFDDLAAHGVSFHHADLTAQCSTAEGSIRLTFPLPN